jgi:hypothetical protein
MTIKKILTMVGVVVGTIILLIAIFVGAIVGIAFYSISQSEATSIAKEFLKKNEILKQDIGEVKDFGTFISGSVKTRNNDGNAVLALKVIGDKKTVNATVYLMYIEGREWRVTGASYKTTEGKTIEILKAYEDEEKQFNY